MFGKRKYHKGRIKKQMWILGGVCRIHSQYYLMVMIHSTLFLFEEETFLEQCPGNKRDKSTLNAMITKNVRKGL